MKERKNAFIILGGISLVLIIACVLLLTEVIKLPERTQQDTPSLGEIVEGITGDRELAEAVNEIYAQARGWQEQVDNYFTGLTTDDAALLLGLYHPVYWEAGGQSLPDALAMMHENVSELTLPQGLTWRVISDRPLEEDERIVVSETYEAYGLDKPITDMIAVEVETTPSLREWGGESGVYQLTFLQIDGSWYLFEDIFQMFY
ncbi:MAG: hypothetical protein FWE69_04340 [Clostridiales bacterium]|nr:hypothetical protein [Clostridiales bacterium]